MLLIVQSACWADRLMALTGMGSTPGVEGFFQLNHTCRNAMRLNSQTGTEGSPVSSLNYVRPLHSGIRAPGS